MLTCMPGWKNWVQPGQVTRQGGVAYWVFNTPLVNTMPSISLTRVAEKSRQCTKHITVLQCSACSMIGVVHKATVCFFFVSHYMDEKNQWGSEIKKQKLQKKKKKKRPQLHQPAPPCDDSASWMSSWSITEPTLHYLAPQCCTSSGPTLIPRRMWRKKASLSSANLYLPITFHKAKVLHDCSFCMQPKGREKRKLPSVQTHGCAERCILCFFLVRFFFLELGKINERV